MTRQQAERAIDNLPRGTTRLTFTGGEVSTRMKELEHAVKYAVEQKTSRFPNGTVAK